MLAGDLVPGRIVADAGAGCCTDCCGGTSVILARVKAAPESTEPIIHRWRCVELDALVGQLPTPNDGTTRVIAVDGRSAGGKTTLAERLHTAIADSVVVHTDDVAWNYSMFDWTQELVDHIIEPVRDGDPVCYQPPGWAANERPGAIELPARLDTLIVEGVGAGRRELMPMVDVLIWVQSDFHVAQQRGLVRDIASGVNGDPDQCRQFWDWWMKSELPFLEEQQPWSRADVIVAGTFITGCSDAERVAAVHP